MKHLCKSADHQRDVKKRHRKRIMISNDVWYDDVFCWFDRAELGLKLALICANFNGLVDRRLKSAQQWSLDVVHIDRSMQGNFAVIKTKFNEAHKECHSLPNSALLDVPPPSNLVGFKFILINYIDQSVLAFLRILNLINNKLDIELPGPILIRTDQWPFFGTHVWPIVAQGMHRLSDMKEWNFGHLRNSVSPSVLRDCANLRVIEAEEALFPVAPAYDRAEASVGQAVAKWMHTARSDGRPKVLRFRDCHSLSADGHIATKLEALKMEFVRAEVPANFIICFDFDDGGQPFELTNERTRERMTFQRYVQGLPEFFWLLKRGPIWWDGNEWAESERLANPMDLYLKDLDKPLFPWTSKMNVISIGPFDTNL